MTVSELNKAALDKFVGALDKNSIQKCIAPVAFPLVLDSVEQEVSLMFWNCILYAPKWNQLVKDGDYLHKIKYGLFSMSISPSLERSNGKGLCSYKFLKDLSVVDVAGAFDIQTHVSEQLQPGLEISKPGPLLELAKFIHDLMQNYADTTGQNGSVVQFLSAIAGECDKDAAKFVERITKALKLTSDSQAGCEMLCQTLYEKYATKFPVFDFGASLKTLPPIIDDYFIRFLVQRGLADKGIAVNHESCLQAYDELIAASLNKDPEFFANQMNSVLWHRYFVTQQQD